MQKFEKITKFLDENMTSKEQSNRAKYLLNFIEIKIWQNFLQEIKLKPDDNFKNLCFCFNNKKLPLSEILFNDFIKEEKNNQFSTEIHIDFISEILKP